MNSFRLLTLRPLLVFGSQSLAQVLKHEGYDVLSEPFSIFALLKIARHRPHLIVIDQNQNSIDLRILSFLCKTVSYFESAECTKIETKLLHLAEKDLQQGTSSHGTTTDQPRTNPLSHSEFDQLLKTSTR